MIILAAPLPGLKTSVILPSPVFQDTRKAGDTVVIKRTMDNTLYTTVKAAGYTKLTYSFNLVPLKAKELREFLQSYYRSKIKLTNHLGEVWEVYFVVNPFEFTNNDDIFKITLEFEGKLITPVTPPNC